MDAPIPVTIITGFLGAGKSTLLERWLGELPPQGTVVIINEQGKIGIDAELLSERTARLREITGGCVCCQAQSELDATLAEFAASSPRPERILVETSGAASPSGVLRAITWGAAKEDLRLDGVVTVLDAHRAEAVLGFDLTTEQLGFADVVVLSHADACSDSELEALTRDLGRFAPAAVMVRADHGHIQGGETMLALLERRAEVLHDVPEHAHATEHGIDSVSLRVDGPLDEERFGEWVEQALGSVAARILRVKGILAIGGVDERVIVQGVGEAIEVTLGQPWDDATRTSRLVVLGLELDAEDLRHGFEACGVER